MTVYFIQCGHNGPVKIGKSDEPLARLRALQSANPYELKLINGIDGASIVEEKLIQKRFQHLRIRGEWYHFDPAMIDCTIEVQIKESRQNSRPRVQSTFDRSKFSDDKFHSKSEVLGKLGCSHRFLNKEIERGTFPQGRQVDDQTMWSELEIADYIDSLPRQHFSGKIGRPKVDAAGA